MDLIDREKLKETLLNPPLRNSLGGMSMADILEIIDDEPAVDAEPVIHAHWIDYDDCFTICSNCTRDDTFREHKPYCGYCGAKMDNGVD